MTFENQVEALVEELEIPKGTLEFVEKWVDEFRGTVTAIPPSDPHKFSSYESFLSPLTLAFPERLHYGMKFLKDEFTWTTPSNIALVGSWSKGVALENSVVDVAVEIPKAFFKSSDYLNQKYLLKRSLWLGGLCKRLMHSYKNVKYTLVDEHEILPAILIEAKLSLVFRIIPVCPPNLFEAKRFKPSLSNVRRSYFFQRNKKEDDVEFDSSIYNQCVLHDMKLMDLDAYVSSLISPETNLRKSLKILRLWLAKRNLDKGYGAFRAFIFDLYVCYLVRSQQLSPKSSILTIIEKVFSSFCQLNLGKAELIFEGNGELLTSLKTWRQLFDAVFLDPSGSINIMAQVNMFTISRVQLEMKAALEIISNDFSSEFSSLFLRTLTKEDFFDEIVRLSLPLPVQIELHKVFRKEELYKPSYLNHSGHLIAVLIEKIVPGLEFCLRKRAKLTYISVPPVAPWSPCKYHETPTEIEICLIKNLEHSEISIEKCISEDEKEIQTFKFYWGENTELRRFRDGTICETVLFGNEDGYSVCSRVVNHILKVAFYGLPEIETIRARNTFSRWLECKYKKLAKPWLEEDPKKNPKRFKKSNSQEKLNEDNCEITELQSSDLMNELTSSFNDLCKIISDISSLPLSVHSVLPACSALRSTSVFPPPPQLFGLSNLLSEKHSNGVSYALKVGPEGNIPKAPKYVVPVDVVLVMETSGKWTDNLRVINRMKCMFLLEIGEILFRQFKIKSSPTKQYIDILKDGFVFRLRIMNSREIHLAKQTQDRMGLTKLRDTATSLALERCMVHLPRFTTTINSISKIFSGFGGTCRLVKRWVASQLLLAEDDYLFKYCDRVQLFTEEILELLVSYLFLHPFPFIQSPSDSRTGLLRFFYLMAYYDFKNYPLIVNFYSKLEKTDIENIYSFFRKRRSTLPVLFIATPDDKFSSVWSTSVSKVVLTRLQKLAMEAVSMIGIKGMPRSEEEAKVYFTPSTDQFHNIIFLKKVMNAKSFQSLNSSNSHLIFNEYKKTSDEGIPIVDFDPFALFVNELRKTFGKIAMFLHDRYGGDKIFIIWKPSVLIPVDFKISNITMCKVADEGQLIIDIPSVLELIEIRGEGLIDKIVWSNSKFAAKTATV